MKRAAKSDPLNVLMKMARKDAEFFHELVFAPKKAVSKVKGIDRATKALLLKVRPGVVLGSLLPPAAPCGNDETCSGATCDNTCAESCGGVTCGGGSCQSTCENSCDDTISAPPMRGGRRGDLVRIRWKRASRRRPRH
jgi:hypothetical protein